jgi:HD-GYP domain-containing protein (c-di-GMP phosphodiesterase class II)
MKKTRPKKTPRASKNGVGKVHALEQKIKELNEWRRRLSVLLKYGKRASATTNLDDLLTLLVDEAKTVLNAERATVFIVDKKEKVLWSKVASGTETIRVPMNKGIVGSVCLTGSIENIRDAYKDSRFNPEVDKKTGYRTTSILACPMRNKKNQVIGVFQILNCKGGRSFDRQDEELITILADQASGYVENAKLYQDIRIGAQQTIVRLAGAVEYKDHDTSAHLWRMSQYSALIAKEMGYDLAWVETLRLAAPMHDIGKIGVPDAILNKPGKLSPEEWVEMKKHPEYGAKILGGSDNELMQMSAEVAWCHHERWDGTGYPRGLKGEEIPIEARIASLADVFDALTSRRIYKPSFSLQETLELINKESGTQFDPTVVEAFHRCLPKIVPIMEEYAPRGDSKEPAKHPGWQN